MPELSPEIKNEIKNIFLKSLPFGTEQSLGQIKEEHQILDLPESDVYVVFPFQFFHDRWLQCLYSYNKPVVISPLPFSEVFSYGNVYYPYFLRDSRELDNLLKLPYKVYLSKDETDLKLILKSLYVKNKINNTNVLCIGEPMYEPFHSQDWGYSIVRAVQERFGLKWKYMSSEKFLKYWKNWKGEIDINNIKSARKIYFSEEKKLYEAVKMYLVLKSLLEKKEAQMLLLLIVWLQLFYQS